MSRKVKFKSMSISVAELRRELLRKALVSTNGKLSPASRLMKISLPTARKLAREQGLWPWKKGK